MIEEAREHPFTCPACWSAITIVLDLSAGGQTMVEDCEVCCRPLVISFETDGDDVTRFDARVES